MEALSRTERNNLRAITGLADANAPCVAFRDHTTSERLTHQHRKENRGKWKNDPVKIAVPQNVGIIKPQDRKQA